MRANDKTNTQFDIVAENGFAIDTSNKTINMGMTKDYDLHILRLRLGIGLSRTPYEKCQRERSCGCSD